MFDLRGLGMFATMCSHAAIGSIGFSPWRVYFADGRSDREEQVLGRLPLPER
jgi:hypothetical protein